MFYAVSRLKGDLMEWNNDVKKYLTVAYYLSRRNEEGYTKLGYSNWSQAFKGLGEKLGRKPRSLQNERDNFDPYTGAPRKGWTAHKFPDRCRRVFDGLKNLTDNELDSFVYELLDSSLKENREKQLLSIIDDANGNAKHTQYENSGFELNDLHELFVESKNRLASDYDNEEYVLSSTFKKSFAECLIKDSNRVEFYQYTTLIVSGKGLKIYLPNQWFILATYAVDLVRELKVYKDVSQKIVAKILEEDPAESEKEVFKYLKDKQTKYVEMFKQKADEYLYKENCGDKLNVYKEFLCKFVTDYAWWGGGKTIERGDCFISPVLALLEVVNESQTFIANLTFYYVDHEELLDSLSIDDGNTVEKTKPQLSYEDLSSLERKTGGYNLIVYGAPGTGKSFFVDHNLEGELHRVVFHPDYSYYDFVGSYKPVPIYEKGAFELVDGANQTFKNGLPHISYQFVPGPFIQALVAAYIDPSHMHTLLIEEINRSNAAAVFGEIFQLLDREETGESSYPIQPSPDLYDYLVMQELQLFLTKGLSIPSNLNIVATMNSADQGVSFMDTAFKRRWRFKYLKIDIDNAQHAKYLITYANREVQWGDFVKALNAKLLEWHVNEDRLIGPYFVKPSELQKPGALDKLLLYIWDDVLRHRRELLIDSSVHGLADLLDRFDKEDVFKINDNLPLVSGQSDAEDDVESEDSSESSE